MKRNKITTLIICLFVSLFLNAQNNTFERELAEAKKGNVKSQSFVAGCYMFGDCGASINYEEAVKWARLAAEKDDDYAQYLLGFAYSFGFGVDIDVEKSIEWYEKSAQQGRKSAQDNLALLYFRGYGIEPNYDRALELFLNAKEEKQKSYFIGACYFKIKRNEEAFKYFQKAYKEKPSLESYIYSLLALEECYSAGLGVKQNSRKAKKLSHELIELEFNNPNVRRSIVEQIQGAYYAFWGLEKDYNMAKHYYEMAKEAGDGADGTYGLATLYMNGLGVEKNYENALDYYNIYVRWCYGLLKNKNPNELSLAIAHRNIAICSFYVGERLYKQKKYNEAFKYLKDAATNQINPIPQAMRMLSACYRYGLGTKIDRKEEADWLERAKNYNDEKALKILNGF